MPGCVSRICIACREFHSDTLHCCPWKVHLHRVEREGSITDSAAMPRAMRRGIMAVSLDTFRICVICRSVMHITQIRRSVITEFVLYA